MLKFGLPLTVSQVEASIKLLLCALSNIYAMKSSVHLALPLGTPKEKGENRSSNRELNLWLNLCLYNDVLQIWTPSGKGSCCRLKFYSHFLRNHYVDREIQGSEHIINVKVAFTHQNDSFDIHIAIRIQQSNFYPSKPVDSFLLCQEVCDFSVSIAHPKTKYRKRPNATKIGLREKLIFSKPVV